METSYVGRNVQRIDAREKVRGLELYPGDLSREGVLTAKLLLAGVPRARILEIDFRAALDVPGVVCVLTADDVPNNVCGLIVPDQPVLCKDMVHHAGDKVAIVVAESAASAEMALTKIRIVYQELPSVSDPQKALLEESPVVHPDKGSNLILESSFSLGDVEIGFAQSDVIIEHIYEVGGQEHGFLAPEAGLAYMDDEDRITVETAGQWAHDDRRQIAVALNLPEEKVRVIYRAIGGAFGGREDVSVQIVLALAALRLKRPVQMVWSRQESFVAHHKRHPIRFKARLGATHEGKLMVASVEVLADGGAYNSTSIPVLANAMLFSTGPYKITNTQVTGKVVYTNNIPSGAMRGFGALQGNFCAEMQIARMADALGMDPVELRRRNLIDQQGWLPNGGGLPFGAKAAGMALEKLVEETRWQFQPERNIKEFGTSRKVRGRGVAMGWKNSGLGGGVPDAAECRVELFGEQEIDRVVLYSAAADVGQGVQTLVSQIAAEVLNVPLSSIQVVGSDTACSPPAGTSSASRQTIMTGNAVLEASRKALDAWLAEDRPAVGVSHFIPPQTFSVDATIQGQLTHYSMGYTAGCAEVEVDLDTGKVTLLSFASALDAGKAINPQQVEGQAHGGISNAVGWTLTEKLIQKDGILLTDDFTTYLLPTILDMPDKIQTFILEVPDRVGPFGAGGIGELPMLTVAPAILSAIYDAAGVWLNYLPVQPEDVWRALKLKKE